jgi:DNA-binding NarL/FixJ family response regulator
MDKKIRIFLASRNQFLCDLFEAVLEDEDDMQVVGRFTSAGEVLNTLPEADVILVDSSISSDSPIELVQSLVAAKSPVRVLVFGLAETKEQIQQHIQVGAEGYILKNDSLNGILERIRGAS